MTYAEVTEYMEMLGYREIEVYREYILWIDYQSDFNNIQPSHSVRIEFETKTSNTVQFNYHTLCGANTLSSPKFTGLLGDRDLFNSRKKLFIRFAEVLAKEEGRLHYAKIS